MNEIPKPGRGGAAPIATNRRLWSALAVVVIGSFTVLGLLRS
jgi:hypothetical protein